MLTVTFLSLAVNIGSICKPKNVIESSWYTLQHSTKKLYSRYESQSGIGLSYNTKYNKFWTTKENNEFRLAIEFPSNYDFFEAKQY